MDNVNLIANHKIGRCITPMRLQSLIHSFEDQTIFVPAAIIKQMRTSCR